MTARPTAVAILYANGFVADHGEPLLPVRAAFLQHRLGNQMEREIFLTARLRKWSVVFCYDMHDVFERFFRVDKARSREMGGTGLGLSIVKHLCQAFGGSVELHSSPGQGSRFTVRLPASP